MAHVLPLEEDPDEAAAVGAALALDDAELEAAEIVLTDVEVKTVISSETARKVKISVPHRSSFGLEWCLPLEATLERADVVVVILDAGVVVAAVEVGNVSSGSSRCIERSSWTSSSRVLETVLCTSQVLQKSRENGREYTTTSALFEIFAVVNVQMAQSLGL